MIGIFDSGVGGLTVVRQLLQQAPDAGFLYLGDTARTPYGNKSPETVTRYACEDAAFLVERGATSLVIACNSASAVVTETLRHAYPQLPIFEVINSAIEAAVRVTRGRVGVIGTRATVGSGVYQRLLKEHQKITDVFVRVCPLFVPLVEEGWLERRETKQIVRSYLAPLRQAQVDTLILGCTHYPLLASLIQRYIGRRVQLIDSGAAVVASLLQTPGIVASGPQRYFVTDSVERSRQVARQWLGREISLEAASLT